MTIGDLATLICSDVGDTDTGALTGNSSFAFCVSQIQMKYEILYQGHNWQEATDTAIVIPPYLGAGNPINDVFLPYFVDRVINAKFSIDGGISYRNLKFHERDWLDKFHQSTFTPLTLGVQPNYYYIGKPVGFPFVPATSGAGITITPVGTTAQIITVLIEGIDAQGGYLSETFSITGSAPTTGTARYTQIVNIAVGTNADIALTFSNGVVGQSVNSQIGGGNLRYVHLVPFPGYDGTQQFKILHKLKIDKIPNVMSIPRVSAVNQALYYFVRGAMYGRQKQKDLELADIQLANTLFEQAKKIELEQAGMIQQIVPRIYDDPGDLFNPADSVY